jgi:hypothetical protein
MRAAGIHTVQSPAEIGQTVARIMQKPKGAIKKPVAAKTKRVKKRK